MAATTVTMPALGESVSEGTVVKWLAQPGQRVERDQPLVEIATDKANTEIPSPTAGVLVEVIAQEGAVVQVGAALARLDDAAQAAAGAPAAQRQPAAEAPQSRAAPQSSAAAAAPRSAESASARSSPPSQPAAQAAPTPQAYGAAPAASQRAQQQGDGNGHLRASPVVRNVAQEHGVDLDRVPGSGPQGRITKADVMSYLDRGGVGPAGLGLVNVEGSADSSEPVVPAGAVSQPPPQQTFPGSPPPSSGPATIPPPVSSVGYAVGPVPLQLRAYKPPRYTPREGDQVIPFDHRRRLIAEHMVYSKVTSPHVPCAAEVDMTPFARLREQWKTAKETGGRAPSFLVGLCRATIQALAEFPRMNAVVQDESLIIRKDINLGVAVDTDKGLLVPVIRRANEKSMLGLARALDDLAARARAGKVTADELSGGSFTVSNPGLKGNLWGASIINQPQVGILRMGEIVKRPVVREINSEDVIVVRQMMYLTLSYDHRVIDGVIGNSFLHRVRELLEEAKFSL
jgi:2-oxoglutarate dehydrogenase E2 component (dihydrolipoamide succinyltransferase)